MLNSYVNRPHPGDANERPGRQRTLRRCGCIDIEELGMNMQGSYSADVLRQNHCFENIDRVANDAQTTDFKRRARLQQSMWRAARELPIGSQPMRPKQGETGRPLGSRLEVDFAYRSELNFLNEAARSAVRRRLESPQPHQTLNRDRLYCDLLSSMPMCFNLFGALQDDVSLADRAVHAWWRDVPGKVVAVHFEWSPGRRIEGRFLENASAFDVAFELDLGEGKRGIFGVETKYHEDCRREDMPSESRKARYEYVSDLSEAFLPGAIESFLGSDLQQMWLDHLLALSMTLDVRSDWAWSGFALVHPGENPSYARSAERYRRLLRKPEAFRVTTIEDLLDTDVLPRELATSFRERYLWEA